MKFVWFLTLLPCLQNLQVNAITKRDIHLDISSVLLEERLPREITPTSYILDIHPFPEEGYFKGRITINLECQEETNRITLHADPELILYHTELVLMEGSSPTRTIKILRSERDPERSWYIIRLRKSLEAGSQAQLSMVFTGKLNTETNKGLFRSSYYDVDTDETRYFVGSFFKPNLARKVFPCFDEPEYKAPFIVSIVRINTMTSLSNMPLMRSDKLLMDPKWVRDYFQESPPMATYSLGILVSDFTSMLYEDDTGIDRNFDATLQIWGPATYLEATQNFSTTIYTAMNNVGEILGTPYPLPKFDYAFLYDLDANNWGLAFHRHPEIISITHNVVSQWFGNLVSPAWWNDECINDALAVYVTMSIIKDTGEDQSIIDEILLSIYTMLDEYSKIEPHDEDCDVEQAAHTTKVFMVLRMFNYTLGETTLMKSLQRFVSETKYKSYTENDVWNAITEQAHIEGILEEDISVNEIASSWISLSRIPLVTVKRNYRDNSATFTQKTYQRLKPHNQEESKHIWWIPIVIRKEDHLDSTNFTPSFWLREETARLTKIGNRDQFIVVNPEEVGPFVVNYDDKNWKLISDYLQTEDGRFKIPTATRAKLLHDALSLAYSGELSCKTALDMTLFLSNEDNYIVWARFFGGIRHIRLRMGESSTAYEKFLHFLRHTSLSLYERLESNSAENEDQGRSIFTTGAKEILCDVGYKQCIEEAKSSFDKWIEADSSGCGDYVDRNVCYIFKWGSDEDYELGLQRVLITLVDNDTNSEYGHALFITLIGCANKPWKIERMLNASIFEQVEEFTDSDIQTIFGKLAENSYGYTTLLEYLIANWDALKERFEDKEDLWNKLIETATAHITTQAGLDLVSNLYAERRDEFGSAQIIIEKSIKTIEEEVEWTNNNIPVIEEWIDNYFADHEEQNENSFLLYEN